MIRKYQTRSVVALLLIPAVAVLAAGIISAIDPELAAGRADYARNFALLNLLRAVIGFAGLALLAALWLLACLSLVRAKSQRNAWLSLALLGPPGFAGLTALADRSPLDPADTYTRQLARLPGLLRIVYEALRFAAFSFVSLQLVEWFDDATALFEATRRGVPVSQVLVERDASSGMWAFGDMMRAAYVFVLIYALWPVAYNVAAGLIRRLRPRGSGAGG